VHKSLLLGAALAAGALFASQIEPAAAAISAPQLQTGAIQGALVQDARWRCGPRRCWWVRGYWGPVPPYARYWGRPPYPGCYWKLKGNGRWKLKCHH
jgi:hypothetical protein